MAPAVTIYPERWIRSRNDDNPNSRSSASFESTIIEGWSQGFLVGGASVLILITVANMRRKLLHNLILLELCLVMTHGTFIFFADPIYGWYLSSTAVPLYISWNLHSVISWLKNKPFLPKWGSNLYIGTVLLATPFWVAEAYLNFMFFNNLGNNHFQNTRPYEAFFRDPWWIFTTCNLVWVIKREYSVGFFELIRASPRFGVLMISMFIAIAFTLTDVIVTFKKIGVDGINPFWKVTTVFKCASDALFLDDFKKVLDTLINHTMMRIGTSDLSRVNSVAELDPQAAHDYGVQPGQSRTRKSSSTKARKLSVFKRHPRPQNAYEGSMRKSSLPSRIRLSNSRSSNPSNDASERDSQRPEVGGKSPELQSCDKNWFDTIGEDELVMEKEKEQVTSVMPPATTPLPSAQFRSAQETGQ